MPCKKTTLEAKVEEAPPQAQVFKVLTGKHRVTAFDLYDIVTERSYHYDKTKTH